MRPNPQEEKWKNKRDDDIALIGVRAHPPSRIHALTHACTQTHANSRSFTHSRIHALTHARKLTFKLLLPRGGGCDEFKSEQVAHLGDRMPGLRRAIEMVRGVPFALQQCVLATDFPFVHLIPGTFLRAMFVSNSRTEQTFKRQNQIPRMDRLCLRTTAVECLFVVKLFLCLSRAGLGKCAVFTIKWRKNGRAGGRIARRTSRFLGR
jgi:hypothetical protein